MHSNLKIVFNEEYIVIEEVKRIIEHFLVILQ